MLGWKLVSLLSICEQMYFWTFLLLYCICFEVLIPWELLLFPWPVDFPQKNRRVDMQNKLLIIFLVTWQDAYRLQLKLFLYEVKQQQLLSGIRSYLKLYSAITITKLAQYMEIDEATLRSVWALTCGVSFLLLLVCMHKKFSNIWTGLSLWRTSTKCMQLTVMGKLYPVQTLISTLMR